MHSKSPSVSPDSVPRRWRRHYRILSALHDQLTKEREGHLREAAAAAEPDVLDSASDESSHEFALNRLCKGQDALYEMDAALKRISNGSYGICEETGIPIPAARLNAVPWTRFRKEAADRAEHPESGRNKTGSAIHDRHPTKEAESNPPRSARLTT